MRTAIFTARNDTTLAIEILADEVVDLVQMGQTTQTGQDARIARLGKGKTTVVVQPGVFKLVSKQGGVRVSPDAADVQVVDTPNNKGDWPDLRLAQTAKAMGQDPKVVATFVDAKSKTVE